MLRFLLIVLLFLLSLLTLFPPPFHFAWYASVLVAAYTVILIAATLILLVWSFWGKTLRTISLLLAAIAVILFTTTIIRASFIGQRLTADIEKNFGAKANAIKGFHQSQAFSVARMFSGTGVQQIIPKIYTYTHVDSLDLQLKFYPSRAAGMRPCLVIVHGGAWNSGSFDELLEEDNYYANAGYQVASINYRLAPRFTSPAPVEDVKTAIEYLTRHSVELQIDTNNFVLLGRSAGGQIVLAAAYTLTNLHIKGVASYYGPTDMIWSYNNPAPKLILDSKALLNDYFGGTPTQVRDKYIAASPRDQVTATTIPTLMVHGGNDAHVSPLQPYRLAEILNRNKVPNLILDIPWASHGCEYHLSSPSGQLCVYATERYFWAVTH